MTKQLPAHPAADLFPMMTGADFDALKNDIRENGLHDPIIVFDGQILDGRNRARACAEIGIEPAYQEWDRHGTPQAFVVSKNLHRRHLTASQRAMIAAKMLTLKPGQRRDRIAARSVAAGNPATTFTRQEAADIVGVHHTTVTAAKLVLDKGTPEEIKGIEAGALSAETVAEQIRAEKPPQKRAKEREIGAGNSGRNPERIQRQRENADMWGRLRGAIENLGGMPLAADAVPIVRSMHRGTMTAEKITRAVNWLVAFQKEWKE